MAGHVSWRVNGSLKCATNLHSVYEYTAPIADFTMQMDTADDGDSLAAAVRSWTSRTLAGVYHCQADAGDMTAVSFAFRSGNSFPAKVQDCTVTLEAPGTVGDLTARGTFSATGTDIEGNLLTLSDGTFDTPTL